MQILNMQAQGANTQFDIRIKGWLEDGEDRILSGFTLPMLGRHNVLNATAAIIVGS